MQEKKYTGVGLEAGYLKFVTSSLGSVKTHTIVSDGVWHYLNLTWANGDVHLHLDQHFLFNQTSSFEESCGAGDVYIGTVNISNNTKNLLTLLTHFYEIFRGIS